MKNIRTKKPASAIALFILITSLVILSIAMRELITLSSTQISRVRNSYDRVQAIYLARSTLALSRFFIIFDSFQEQAFGENNEASDSFNDQWAEPLPFPIPIEALSALQAQVSGEEQDLSIEQKAQLNRCGEFFDDFQGSAVAQIEDLSARINLNDMEVPEVYESFLRLITPSTEFINSLDARNLRAQEIAAQIQDYMDRDLVRKETNQSEQAPYRNAELPYEPKNLPFSVLDELKLIPSMDDELFEYLSQFVSAYRYSGRAPPGKINLNTVSQEVFQALLRDSANPQETAQEFIEARDSGEVRFTNSNIEEQMEFFGLEKTQIPMSILGGVSEAFLTKIESEVGSVNLELEAIIKKPRGNRDPEPISRIRLNP